MSDKHNLTQPLPNSSSGGVSSTSQYFKIEKEMIEYWKQNKIFERSVEERPTDKQWNFLDGPPFITGLPHYGTLLSSIPKDVFPRYKTMQGYRVRRVWGWDCHGLPAENKVENALGLKSKREIEEKVGVKKFIDECKLYVNDVSSAWEWYIDHVGRWVDFKNSYRTMDREYMESVMWVFKQMYEKGHIYKGLRVSLFCPHCSTPISNFEVAMDANENYKEIREPANTYKYKVIGEKDTYFLAWSTTPWTKLTTTALAVNPDLVYVAVEYQNERFILAESTLENVFSAKGAKIEDLKVLGKKTGAEMVGLQYEGHYDFYKPEEGKKLHVIVADTFVTADEGTGIVTLAPYGEEDLKVMQRDNIQIVRNVNDEGKLIPDNPNGWGGVYLTKVNALVNEDLANRGLMFHEDPKHLHTIAHCWRCHTRLFYNPQEAWYVNVQQLKPTMAKTNEEVNWYPGHFKQGRFLKSMEGAPDWCISRSRYWGSPVPVWECECGERFVPGSIAELEKEAGATIADLHKPDIDEITISCKKCQKRVQRVPEVLDSWIEAGSASFAERHFPFNKDGKQLSDEKQQEYLTKFFPPDFITEYTGQIRAWFYVLHVIAAAIYGKPAFKNVLVNGVILGTDGRKMSKNYKNYPDPKEVIEKYGGDALRLYLLGSPITKAEDICISEQEYRDQLRKFIIPLLNIWNFYETYANVDGFRVLNLEFRISENGGNVLDKWLLSRLNSTIKAITVALEEYDTSTTVSLMIDFVNDWSKWHVRRSRDRAGSGELTVDAQAYYETTTYVFERFLRAIAPIVPFHSEYLYCKLTGAESVHLQSWPQVEENLIHLELEGNTTIARQICEIGHQIRKTNAWKVRKPLAKLEITIDADCSKIKDNIWQTVLDELNVKNIVVNGSIRYPNPEVVVTEEELQHEGDLRDLIREIQGMRKDKNIGVNELVNIQVPKQFAGDIEYIKRRVRAKSVEVGESVKLL
jgi:isoleucyl-tRNA synthetase